MKTKLYNLYNVQNYLTLMAHQLMLWHDLSTDTETDYSQPLTAISIRDKAKLTKTFHYLRL